MKAKTRLSCLRSKNWRHTAKCSWMEPLDKHGSRGSWGVLDWTIDYRPSSVVSQEPFTQPAPKQIEPLSDPLRVVVGNGLTLDAHRKEHHYSRNCVLYYNVRYHAEVQTLHNYSLPVPKAIHMHSYQSAHAIILLSDLLPCHECMQGKELVHMIIIMYAHAYMNACMYDNYGGLCTSTATFGAPRMHLHTYIHTYIHTCSYRLMCTSRRLSTTHLAGKWFLTRRVGQEHSAKLKGTQD